MNKLKISALRIAVMVFINVLFIYSTSVFSRTIRTGKEAAPLAAVEGKSLPGDRERFDSYVYSIEKLKKNYNNVIVLDGRTKDEYKRDICQELYRRTGLTGQMSK